MTPSGAATVREDLAPEVLERWSAALSRLLAKDGAAPGAVAGIWADPGPALIVAALAASEAGLALRLLADPDDVTGLEVLLADGTWPGWDDPPPARAGHSVPQVVEIDGAAVIELLAAGSGSPQATETACPAATERYPAAPAQRQMWVLDQFDESGVLYTIGVAWRLDGQVNDAALDAAFDDLQRRHPGLRTQVALADQAAGAQGGIVQIVAPEPLVHLERVAVADEQELLGVRRRLPETQLRLDGPPLLRGWVIRSRDGGCELHLALHHAICDEWSLELIGRDLAALYRHHLTGEPHGLPAVATTPGEQAAGADSPQRRLETDDAVERAAGLLRDAPPLLDLPTDHPRVSDGGAPLGVHLRRLQPATWEALAALRQQGFSSFHVVTAAYGLALAHAAGQDDIVIGTVVTERGAPELSEVVGMFVNTVPMRLRLPRADTLGRTLEQTREAILDAFDAADAPFDELVARLRPERAEHQPIFQHLLILAPAIQAEAAGDGLSFRPVPVASGGARFDLTLYAIEYPDAMAIRLDYNSDLYDEPTVARLAADIETAIRAVGRDARLPVRDLPWLTREAADSLTRGRVRTRAASQPRTVDGLILDQAASTPSAVAVEEIDAAGRKVAGWTYAELARDARRVASALRATGVAPGDVVASTGAGGQGVVAFLATVGIGATWLPLDPAQPADRLRNLLQRSGCRSVLGPIPEAALPEGILAIDLAGVLRESASADGGHGGDDPLSAAGGWPDRLPAYLIFTSGSTGEPKGVFVPHEGLRNLALGFVERHAFTADDAILALPPLFFDAALGDLVPALITGGRLVLHREPAVLTGPGVLSLVAEHAITSVDAPSSLWQRWVEDLGAQPTPIPPGLTRMMVGGEAVPLRRVLAWAGLGAARVRLYNHYGPTEASICATVQDAGHPIDPDNAELRSAGSDLAIGVGLPDVRVYVLDDTGQPVAPGIRGEICIGGPGVALGYLADPRATAAAFVPDPYADRPGARMYRTGDIGHLDHDGRVHFSGRRDGQVKIRGRRIELGEVEAAVAGLDGVSAVAITAPPAADGNRRLVAYVVAESDGADSTDLDGDALREALRRRVPRHLIPDVIVPIDALPLTPQGKLDLRALPEPPAHRFRPAYASPETPTEQTIAGIWQDNLGVERVGLRDRFTDLGGHSLAAATALGRINVACGSAVQLGELLGPLDLQQVAARADATAGARGTAATTNAATTSRLLRDSELPQGITVPATAAISPPRRILLTGATGLLGGHLLAALLQRSDAEIVALVRAPGAGQARQRVAEALDGLGLPGGDSPRLTVLRGELDRPDLGLDRADWQQLAESVDAVLHSAGLVNFVEDYDALKAPNVDGTTEIIRLATAARAVPVHFVGTLGVFLTPQYAGTTVTEATVPGDAGGLHDGYNRSKWVADRLVQQLGPRGLPVSIHRPARITGATGSGRGNPDDWFSSMLVACAEIGMVPDLPGREDMTPVDVVAAAIATVTLRPDIAAGAPVIGHYYNPRTVGYGQLAAALAAEGHPVRLVPYAEWWAALRAAVAGGAARAFAPYAGLLRHPDAPATGSRPEFDSTATFARAAAAGIHCPPADEELVRAQLRFLVGLGRLDVAGAAHG